MLQRAAAVGAQGRQWQQQRQQQQVVQHSAHTARRPALLARAAAAEDPPFWPRPRTLVRVPDKKQQQGQQRRQRKQREGKMEGQKRKVTASPTNFAGFCSLYVRH